MALILTSCSTDVNFIASQAVARGQQNGNGEHADEAEAAEGEDAMAALERQARAPAGFVAASTGPQGGNIKPVQEAAANPDAIDVDDDL
jgi:pre-mRNA-splicing factor SYF1